ncbi:MAG TPA: DUF427 domain-containing protein [Thermodesulfobacteriota bacterium]|nr:DUF427 domain-containing protein [Thermodesulfobacteriota bacterium]
MNEERKEGGRESVLDYPETPRVEETPVHVEIFFNDVLIADSSEVKRVLEKGLPPVYYIPAEDVEMKYLSKSGKTSHCKWKGEASYYNVRVHDAEAVHSAWSYEDPKPGYGDISGYIAFYSEPMQACYVDGELVERHPPETGGWLIPGILDARGGN